jgi:N-acetylglucosaminyl-diphospho-decaprenol L-rhamnosyltransferase
MKVFISVVSHGHANLINDIMCLSKLSESFRVIVKSNCPGDDFSMLEDRENFYWLDTDYYMGFGANNNLAFNYSLELGMSDSDYFIVLNPDVYVTVSTINSLISAMSTASCQISTLNLYKDRSFKVYDNSIRKFPTFWDFSSSILGFENKSIIDKSKPSTPLFIDWAAGSFLAFKAEHYKKLRGFNEKYFMYCEDIDICQRSSNLGVRVRFFEGLKAIHLAKHDNRNIFSKHFIWHLVSSFRYLFSKKLPSRVKSSIRSL